MKLPFLPLLLIAAAPFASIGAEGSMPPPDAAVAGAPGEDVGAPAASGIRRGGFEAMRRNMETLKQKFPDEYAELEELRESGDRRAAMEKMRGLMKKAGIEMPAMRGPRNRPDGDGESGTPEQPVPRHDPLKEFFAALEKADAEAVKSIRLIQSSQPAEALAKYRELAEKHKIAIPPELTLEALRGIEILPRDVVKMTMSKLDGELRRRFPGEFSALLELRETDPSAARAEFRRLLRKAELPVEMLKANAVGLQLSTGTASSGTAAGGTAGTGIGR